jgi:hypothetical protein
VRLTLTIGRSAAWRHSDQRGARLQLSGRDVGDDLVAILRTETLTATRSPSPGQGLWVAPTAWHVLQHATDHRSPALDQQSLAQLRDVALRIKEVPVATTLDVYRAIVKCR